MVSEKRKEQMRQAQIRYRERHKDDEEYKNKRKERKQKYIQSEKGQQKVKEYSKKWYNENKEKQQQYYKEGDGKKSNTISNWKLRGVVSEDYDKLYEKYVNTDKCEICEKVFTDTFDRCLDHDHQSGLFRQVLCRNCNTQDNWKKK